jgi:hypothetical protein
MHDIIELANNVIAGEHHLIVQLLRDIDSRRSATSREILILTPEWCTLCESSLNCRTANEFRAGRSQMPVSAQWPCHQCWWRWYAST